MSSLRGVRVTAKRGDPMQRRRSIARIGGLLVALCLLLTGFMVQVGPAAAYASTFANTAPIALNSVGNTPPNPSTINVSGFATGIQSVAVTTYNSSKIVNLNLSGPTAGQNYNFTIPAGTATTQLPLGASAGTSPNGIWTLSVLDPAPAANPASPDSIAGGWSLFIVGQPAPTTTTVKITPNPSVYGTPSYTLTATVLATTTQQSPTGIVTFGIDATTLGSVGLVPSTTNSSTATYTFDANSTPNPATLLAGQYTITASYPGNGDFTASSDSAILTIGKAATSNTQVIATPSTFPYGANTINFSAVITNTSNNVALTGGTVTFSLLNSANVTIPCTPAMHGVPTTGSSVTATGSCTLPDTLVAGSYTATAIYSGDANFLGSSGSGATGGVTVTKSDTTLAITSPNDESATQYCGIVSVDVSAALTASNNAAFGLPNGSNGSVTFTILKGMTVVGQTTVQVTQGTSPRSVNGTVSFSTAVRSGTYTITASYNGSAQFNASTAQNSTLTLFNVDTTTTVNPTNVTAVYGDSSVQLSASVVRIQGSGTVTSGTVTFTVRKGNAIIGVVSGAVVGGTATANFPLNGSNAGNYTFTAKYNGDDCYNASTSSPETVGVLKIAKRILWIKPVDRTRTSTQANPVCSTVADIEVYLENGRPPVGTGLANGDTLQSAVTLANGFACTYGVTNGTVARPTTPGKAITSVNSVLSDNYTIRYKTGMLTVIR